MTSATLEERMYRLGILIKILVPMLLLLASCDVQRRDWQRDWLAGKPCSPPCWQGITPGVTTGTEVEAILRQKAPLKRLETIGPVFNFDRTVTLSWEWAGIGARGQVSYDLDTGLVYRVTFGCSGLCAFTFGEIIDTYGEPSHIYVNILEPYCNLSPGREYHLEIFYIDRGFALYPSYMVTSKPDINRDLRFGMVEFFVPTIEGFVATRGGLRWGKAWREALYPWQGFKSFDEYICLARPDLCSNKEQP